MKVLIRKTANGSEYWDNIEKKTIFVPTGCKPSFEVTENPDSMLSKNQSDTPDGPITLFEDMTIKELRAYAKENEITIPTDVKKQEELVRFLNEATIADGIQVADTE